MLKKHFPEWKLARECSNDLETWQGVLKWLGNLAGSAQMTWKLARECSNDLETCQGVLKWPSGRCVWCGKSAYILESARSSTSCYSSSKGSGTFQSMICMEIKFLILVQNNHDCRKIWRRSGSSRMHNKRAKMTLTDRLVQLSYLHSVDELNIISKN